MWCQRRNYHLTHTNGAPCHRRGNFHLTNKDTAQHLLSTALMLWYHLRLSCLEVSNLDYNEVTDVLSTVCLSSPGPIWKKTWEISMCALRRGEEVSLDERSRSIKTNGRRRGSQTCSTASCPPPPKVHTTTTHHHPNPFPLCLHLPFLPYVKGLTCTGYF